MIRWTLPPLRRNINGRERADGEERARREQARLAAAELIEAVVSDRGGGPAVPGVADDGPTGGGMAGDKRTAADLG